MAKTHNKRKAASQPSFLTIAFWLGIGIVLIYGLLLWTSQHDTQRDKVEVKLPAELSRQASLGEKVFQDNCVACHGVNAGGGTGNGPPLVHIIYEPSHHGDAAFTSAVQIGVQMHHWNFGNMPKIEAVNPNQMKYIIAYVRELQRANGIN